MFNSSLNLIYQLVLIVMCYSWNHQWFVSRLPIANLKMLMLCLRDWSRSGGSYGNNTRRICCPAPGRPESAARGMSPPDNKSRGYCCRNSRPTVINPDYNMTKQRYITCIYAKIHSKSPPNRATSPSCLHCDVTHLFLMTWVVALHIPSWRVWVCEEHRKTSRHVKPCGQLMQVEWFVAIKIIYVESSITINISESVFVMYKSQV